MFFARQMKQYMGLISQNNIGRNLKAEKIGKKSITFKTNKKLIRPFDYQNKHTHL